tara:strand:+ start:2544 stop:2735 length:192 start_codon:yes stop_codon:yes gene_type:complete
MKNLSEIDLGSFLLFAAVILGFIATGFVIIRLSIIAINFISYKLNERKELLKEQEESNSSKGF